MSPLRATLVRMRCPLFAVFLSLIVGCQGPGIESTREQSFLGPQSDGARGEQRVLVVAVRFPDVEPAVSLDQIKRKAVAGLSRYVSEQSYGLTWVNADFKGGVMLPDPISAYKISPYNFQVDRTRVRKLAEDTLTALEKDVDFSGYDHMLIVPRALTQPGKGYGMICYCANPGMLSGVRGDVAYVKLESKNKKNVSRRRVRRDRERTSGHVRP